MTHFIVYVYLANLRIDQASSLILMERKTMNNLTRRIYLKQQLFLEHSVLFQLRSRYIRIRQCQADDIAQLTDLCCFRRA